MIFLGSVALACDSEPSSELNDASVAADRAVSSDATGGADAIAHPDAEAGDAGTIDSGANVDRTPITAPEREWTWVDFPESRCLNGTPTGLGVNLVQNATTAVIFLTGGNACFNQLTCFITANTDGYGATKFEQEKTRLVVSLFDRTHDANRFKDASFVFVPYCSGDVYSGTREDVMLEGSRYTYWGWHNMEQFLARVVPTLSGVESVLLTGVSAGGFGAFLNFDHVQRAFGPNVRVTLIDDSGPAMGSDFISPCLQAHFRTLWGFDEGPLAACGAPCATNLSGAFIEDYAHYLLTEHPDRNMGVISSDADQTIRGFWGFGNDMCRNLFGTFTVPTYDPAHFRAGLLDFRDRIAAGAENFKLYMPVSTRHGWLDTPPWTIEHYGVNLNDWIGQAVTDDPAWDNVPPP